MLNLLCFLTVIAFFLLYLATRYAANAKNTAAALADSVIAANMWRDLYLAEVRRAQTEANAERKLWTNKALVRAGGNRIFDDSYIIPDLPASTETKKDDDFQTPTELLTPFAERRRQWKAQDQKEFEALGTLPTAQQERIKEDLKNLSNPQQ